MPALVATVRVQAAAPVKPLWVERTLIFRRPAGNVVALDGWVYGQLAVHATWSSPNLPPVTICHLPSMLAVARLAEVNEAVAQVEWLWESCPRAFTGEVVDTKQLTEGVLQWLQSNQR